VCSIARLARSALVEQPKQSTSIRLLDGNSAHLNSLDTIASHAAHAIRSRRTRVDEVLYIHTGPKVSSPPRQRLKAQCSLRLPARWCLSHQAPPRHLQAPKNFFHCAVAARLPLVAQPPARHPCQQLLRPPLHAHGHPRAPLHCWMLQALKSHWQRPLRRPLLVPLQQHDPILSDVRQPGNLTAASPQPPRVLSAPRRPRLRPRRLLEPL
jgi:hypothetical protein